MATSKKFSVRIVRIGTSGTDSIAIALSKDATMAISPKEGSRGVLKISAEGAEFSFDLSGYSPKEYGTVQNFMDGRICEDVEFLDGILYIAKADSDSAKAKACGSQWKRDGKKFALCAKFHGEGIDYISGSNVFELRDSDGKLLAAISGFGISSTRLDSWIGDTGPIGKLGKLSAADRLKLDVARQQEIVEAQQKALAASQKVLAELVAKLPKKEQQAMTA